MLGLCDWGAKGGEAALRHRLIISSQTPIPSTAETCPALSRGVSHRLHSIKLCIFIYKFIHNLHYWNEIASSTPPPYINAHYKTHSLQ